MPIIDPTPQQVLDLELGDNDSGASTVRGYLVALLRALWQQQDGFSGKRPFGNSGWDCDFIVPFARAGFIDLALTEEDSWTDYDYRAVDWGRVDALMNSAINALGETR
jgi:hypothetical protein